ncbi:MAG: (2Fe-2S) ferredoxin domain-containing protein [Bacteroidetes bacterium]|nr:(2Fe-2S) ferredoxin domain-containing protein [Bacteroidota bacterium]
MKFEKHIFICTNERVQGERKSCGEAHGLHLVKAFKKLVKDHALNTSVRAQRAGCLDACEFGPSMVVDPEGVFYGSVKLEDVDEIFNEHVLNNRPVKRLVIKFREK